MREREREREREICVVGFLGVKWRSMYIYRKREREGGTYQIMSGCVKKGVKIYWSEDDPKPIGK